MMQINNFEIRKMISYPCCDEGKLHRLDGQPHRVDGPAYIRADGTQEWWVEGKRHRLDGPAVVRADGTQEWWVEGKRHRLDGPAYIDLHRLDGPAVVRADGTQTWWVNDMGITSEVVQWMREQQIPPYVQWTDREKVLFKLWFS